jgi:hypothetical protein
MFGGSKEHRRKLRRHASFTSECLPSAQNGAFRRRASSKLSDVLRHSIEPWELESRAMDMLVEYGYSLDELFMGSGSISSNDGYVDNRSWGR